MKRVYTGFRGVQREFGGVQTKPGSISRRVRGVTELGLRTKPGSVSEES
jgi:hypothetical protein